MNLGRRYSNLENPLLAERRVELVVIFVVLLLVLQLLWGGFRSLFPAVPDPVQPRPNSLEVMQLQTGAQIDPELRAQIAARPLFWSTRRSMEAKPGPESVAEAKPDPAEKQQPGKIDGVKLTGVFGSGDAAGIIVLAKGKKRRVMVGEEVNGWKLQSVEPTEVVFSSNGRQASLALKQGAIAVSQANDGAPVETSDTASEPGKKAANKRTARQKESNDTLILGRRTPSDKT